METQTPTQPQIVAHPHGDGQSQPAPRRYVRPRASVTENADGFTVEVEMPGVAPQGLEITFENGELTLTGHRAAGGHDGHEVVHRESHGGSYRRVFEVDGTIDASRIAAHIDQGLLTLSLPKAEAAKPRRIQINRLN